MKNEETSKNNEAETVSPNIDTIEEVENSVEADIDINEDVVFQEDDSEVIEEIIEKPKEKTTKKKRTLKIKKEVEENYD